MLSFLLILLMLHSSWAGDRNIRVSHLAAQDEITAPLIEKFDKAIKGTPYKAIYIPYPMLRSIQNLESNQTEVELARKDIDDSGIVNNYIRVKTPISHYTSGYFFQDKKFLNIKNIDKENIRIGIVRGSLMASEYIKNFKKVTEVESPESLTSLLLNGRIDVYFEKLTPSKIRLMQKNPILFLPVQRTPVYTYVRKDLSSLVPILDKYYKNNISKSLEEGLKK